MLKILLTLLLALPLASGASTLSSDLESWLEQAASLAPSAEFEQALHQRLVDELRETPQPRLREALEALTDYPVIALRNLEDVGRTRQVPAYPVASAAAALLRSWDRQSAAMRIEQALSLPAVPAKTQIEGIKSSHAEAWLRQASAADCNRFAELSGNTIRTAVLSALVECLPASDWAAQLAVTGEGPRAMQALAHASRVAPEGPALLRSALENPRLSSWAALQLSQLAADDAKLADWLWKQLDDPRFGASLAVGLGRHWPEAVDRFEGLLTPEMPELTHRHALLGLASVGSESSAAALQRARDNAALPIHLRQKISGWLR